MTRPAVMPPSWLTGRADTGGVPALLDRLAQSMPIVSIDELWLFPTRRLTGVESTVFVLSLYTDELDRRRVVTVHFKSTRNKRGEAAVQAAIEDVAVAPADRLTRVIDGVLRRLGDDLSATPQTARISGEDERYQALIEAIASGIEIEEVLERRRGAGAELPEALASADPGREGAAEGVITGERIQTQERDEDGNSGSTSGE